MAAGVEFTVHHEAWYAPGAPGGVPGRVVELQHDPGDGSSSYAMFAEHSLGVTPAVRLEVWSDGWRILRDHLSLFTRITARMGAGCSLEEVVEQLVEYGCTDVTPRARPEES